MGVFVSYARARQDLRSTFVDIVFDDALQQIARVRTDDFIDAGAHWNEAKHMVRFAVETLAAAAFAWLLFRSFAGDLQPRVVRIPLAAFGAIAAEGLLVSIYVDLVEYFRDESDRARRSLWQHLRWRWRVRASESPNRPVWPWLLVLFILGSAAHLFDAPVAIPAVTLLLVAAARAAKELFTLYIDMSFREYADERE